MPPSQVKHCNIRLLSTDAVDRIATVPRVPDSHPSRRATLAKTIDHGSKSLCVKPAIIALGDSVRDTHRDIFLVPCRRGRSTLRPCAKAGVEERAPRPVQIRQDPPRLCAGWPRDSLCWLAAARATVFPRSRQE